MLEPLALSLAGWTTADDVRTRLRLAGEWGFRTVTLDATAPGVRARELDRSARRDLGATLRRLELAFAGLDLWIPAEHFADGAHADRAVAAALGAIELASDLASLNGRVGAGPVIALSLPEGAGDVRTLLATRAGERGCVVADFGGTGTPSPVSGGALGVGVDPARVLKGGGDPALYVTQGGAALEGARLSDASADGRCAVGSPGGRLRLVEYAGALIGAQFARPVVCDLRALRDPARAAARGLDAWSAFVAT